MQSFVCNPKLNEKFSKQKANIDLVVDREECESHCVKHKHTPLLKLYSFNKHILTNCTTFRLSAIIRPRKKKINFNTA